MADALSHVFGYTVANDVTARDRQVRKTPEGMVFYELGRGKAFDSSLPLGPTVTTADSSGEISRLTMVCNAITISAAITGTRVLQPRLQKNVVILLSQIHIRTL